jgi:hypothetical protein
MLKPGVHHNIAADVYHADPCKTPSASASILATIDSQSPAHAWVKHPRLNPDFEPENKTVFDLGSAAHNMVLRQDFWREEIEVIEAANWYSKAAREARDEAHEAGRHPVLRWQFEALEKMVGTLEAHPNASRAFTEGQPEASLIWEDEKTGCLCRCRPDWMPDDVSRPWPDYKTTQSAKPGEWDRRFLLDHGGLIRLAFYEEGIRVTTGHMPIIYLVVQEVTAPHAIVVRTVGQNSNMMVIARRKMRAALDRWAECLKKDEWPSYDLVGILALPEWAEKKLNY